MHNIYLEFIKNMLTFAAQKQRGVAQLVARMVRERPNFKFLRILKFLLVCDKEAIEV